MSRPYQAKLKLSPDGLGSIIRILSPNSLGNSAKVQQASDSPELVDEGTGEVTGLDCYLNRPNRLIAGKGGLGNKSRMSPFSKKSVRAVLAAMELENGIENCIFPTLTLPSVDIAAYEGLARYSAYVCNRLSVIIERYFRPDLFPNMSRCFIWEYQDRGALHLHIAISSLCMDAISLKDFERFLRLKWIEILEDVSRLYVCNCFVNGSGREWNLWELLDDYVNGDGVVCNKIPKALCKVEFVRKSLVSYLAGYLSKSNHEGKDDEKNQLRKRFYPIATWAQWNRNAMRNRKKWTLEIDLGYIDPPNLEAYDDCVEVLISCIPIPEKTAFYTPENPYCKGYTFISPRSEFPVKMIKEFIDDMRLSGITRGIVSFLKDRFDFEVLEKYRLGILPPKEAKNLLAWNDVRREKNRKANRAKNNFIAMNGLFAFIEKIGDIVNVQYPVIKQLEIDYG